MIKLGSVLKIQHGYAFKSSQYVQNSQYRLVTLGNFDEGNNCFKYNEPKATYYGGEFPKEFVLSEGDLIMPLTEQVIGLFGNTAFVPNEERFTFVLNQRVGKVICDEEKLDKYYAHYLLATELVKKQLEARASGTKQRNISPNDVYDVDVELPDIITQKKIGDLLYKIESKMSLNNSICDMFEALLKQIYEYWFVQYDFPNQNGKPYKSSGGKMIWSEELGVEIPNDWEVKPVLSLFDWIGTSQPPKSTFVYEPQDGYVRFIQNRDYSDKSHITYIPLSDSTKLCDEYDIMIDKYGDAGRTRFGIAGAYNVALSKIQVHDRKMKEFVRSYLSSDIIYNYLNAACTASTRASLNEDNFEFLSIAVPANKGIIERYESIAHNIIKRILMCKDENQDMADLRDFILPMLMNGQIMI